MNATVHTQSDTIHRCRGAPTFHFDYRAQQWRTPDFWMKLGQIEGSGVWGQNFLVFLLLYIAYF